jgi:serine/threonine-protein kinase
MLQSYPDAFGRNSRRALGIRTAVAKPSAETKPARVLDGRYELHELIGSGGMAQVWRGRDRKLGRDVAVKILPGGAASDPSRRRRIEREARTLAAFSDPNIVALYDYGEEGGHAEGLCPYLVMEYVDGPDLHRFLREHGRLDTERAVEILASVSGAVARAHDAGIVHGDLKPANVFVDGHGPKVGDFGVARVLDEETGSTTLAATPAFAAPEVLRGAKPTPVSDVYSLGCLAFEMLTGHPPYEGGNAWEVATKHLEAPVPSVRVSRPDVPVTLDEAIRQAMRKDPRRRPRSPRAFAEMLGTTERTMPVTPPASPEAASDRTEALPHRPQLDDVAVYGPFAGVARRIARPREDVRPHGSRRALAAAIVLGVAVPLIVLVAVLGSRGPRVVHVPDVRGMSEAAATAALQRVGLAVAGVSYEPVTSGAAGVVTSTIPAAGTSAKRGTKMHLIATALEVTPSAATPEPVPAAIAPAAPAQRPHNHGHGHGGGDG